MVQTTQVNGLNIEYLEIGKGKDLLFLHGAFSSFRFYRPLLNKLAKKYHILAPVLPGMGRSQKLTKISKEQTLKEYVKTLNAFVNKHLMHSDFVIVGHSLGGYLGLKLLLGHKIRAEKIVMINSPTFKISHYYLTTIRGWTGVSLQQLKHVKTIGVKDLIPWDVFNMGFRRPGQFVKVFRALDTIKPFNKDNLDQHKLTIFTSKDDTYISPDHAYYLARIYPDANLKVIPKGGHTWFYFDDKPLLKLLLSNDFTANNEKH